MEDQVTFSNTYNHSLLSQREIILPQGGQSCLREPYEMFRRQQDNLTENIALMLPFRDKLDC